MGVFSSKLLIGSHASVSSQEFHHVAAIYRLAVVLRAVGRMQQGNQENYSKLSAGMPKAEVETLLGKPADCSGALGMSSCTWGDKNSFISVQFAGDKVLMFSGQGLK